MDIIFLLQKIERHEQRLRELEAENRRLRAIATQYEQLTKENEQLKLENAQLKETLKHYADAKTAKKPTFDLNYSSQRNEPEDPNTKKKRKKKKSRKPAGRKPKTNKPDQAHRIISLYPEGVSPKKCIFVREQFVWRLLEHKAQYVHYKIFDLPDSKTPPTILGVRGATSEYGIEFLLMLAHHVYWTGLSIDKARSVMQFYTDIDIPKSQADTMLYQLANDWQSEYEEIAKRIAVASILYIDETAWKLGKKSCYTWVFGTFADVYYRCGVGRGKDVLMEVLGEKFGGTGVTDDYSAYDSIFTRHQLCWAHFLRKAIELMLRNPTEKKYRNFYLRLLWIYRKAKRYQNDGRLTTGRDGKVFELQAEITKLCKLVSREIVSEKQAKDRGLDVSCVTPEPLRKLILLQRELVEKLECLFVFVSAPAVDSTNNQSERDLRNEAQARQAGRTSKTAKGARRRSTILSVFGTLKRRMASFTLANLLKVVFDAYAQGISLFAISETKNQKMNS
jgi:regulator of replication initiation timing